MAESPSDELVEYVEDSVYEEVTDEDEDSQGGLT